MVDRRRRAWADSRFATFVTTADQVKTDLLAGLAATETKTVTRVIIDMHFNLFETSENEATQVIDLAIGVVSREAFDLGTFPDANATGDYPQTGWLYVATKPVMSTVPGGGTAGGIWRIDASFMADIRAQRKVDRGVLYMTYNMLALSGTAQSVRVVGRVRVLCLT